MKRLSWIFVGVLIVTFLLVSSGREGLALMLKVSLEELTDTSQSIIVGTVTDIRSQWNKERTAIYTHVTISVEEQVKGTSYPREVTIRQPGGKVGDIRMKVSDMPTFKKGEEVVVFLEMEKGKEVLRVTGMMQGKFSVKIDPTTGEKVMVSEEKVLVSSGCNLYREEQKEVSLEEFVKKIKAISQRKK